MYLDWSFMVWALLVYGMANILVFSSLLHPFRVWLTYSKKYSMKSKQYEYVRRDFELPGKLISCIMCVGFWAGAVASLLFYSPSTTLIGDCFLGSATCWILYLFLADKQSTHG